MWDGAGRPLEEPGRTLARREQLRAQRWMAEEHISGDDHESTSPVQDS